MRTPRKLKKGARTLHGNPRTKWQRRAQRTFITMFTKIGTAAAVAATTWQVLEQGLSEFRKDRMVIGGITHPDAKGQFPDAKGQFPGRQLPPNRPQASIITDELVLNKEQQKELLKKLEVPLHLLQTDCVISADALLHPEDILPLPPGKRLVIPKK